MPFKPQKRLVGDVVEISLPDGFKGYAITLKEAAYAFYDLHVMDRPSLDDIINRSIVFRVAVMNSAVKKGRWTVIGSSNLTPELEIRPPQFIQDPIKKANSVYMRTARYGQPAGKNVSVSLEPRYGLRNTWKNVLLITLPAA